MIRAVIFDLDDTLFPEYEFVLSGFRAAGEVIAHRFKTDALYDRAKDLFHRGIRGTVFNAALEQMGINPAPDLIRALVGVYREHAPAIRLYDDVRRTIDHCRTTHKLGILTDGYLTTQRNKVQALGIAPFLDVLVYSDAYGREHWKPSRLPYETIMRTLGYSGDAYLYVADNPEKDFITARRLGWQTCRICRENGEYARVIAQPGYEADFQIETLLELEKILA